MAHQYAKVTFTKAVRDVQKELNSRAGYASMDEGEDYNYLLSEHEAEFIAQRDSFYMASVSETNWPYVQHRGGPAGFLKVLDASTLGFADYKGNRQYISTGNFRNNNRVSIILMDYPNRRRLKILGEISLVAPDDWQTLAVLEDDHYRVRVERAFKVNIVAFDWNCPQHITPRYSEAELNQITQPLIEKIQELETKTTSSVLPHSKLAVGDGELPLIISGIRQLTPEIRAYELRHAKGIALPKITAGSHIQVPIVMPDQVLAWRNYSISSNPSRTDCYEIAVKYEAQGNGGSKALHQSYQMGTLLNSRMPENFFPLADCKQSDEHVVLIAAGIGITPIKSMAIALEQQGRMFELHYAGRSFESMAYTDRLEKQLAGKLHLYPSKGGKKLSLQQVMSNRSDKTSFYFCGPQTMLIDFKSAAKSLAIADERVHYEQFSAPKLAQAKSCRLTLSHSKVDIEVEREQSLLEAVLAAGVDVPYSCMSGECKSCVVEVTQSENSADMAAKIEHLDECLTEQEKAAGKMCLCVSRPLGETLAIEL